MKSRRSTSLIMANTFGTLGYFSALFQWAWSALILLYPLFISRPHLLFPEIVETPRPALEIAPIFSPFVAIIVLTITIIILIATTFMILRLPKTVGQRGAQLTHITAASVVPIISGHKKVTKKKRRQLSYRIILLAKLFLVVAPLVALCFAQPIQHITTPIIWAVAQFCALFTVFYFVLQQIIVKLTRLDTDMVW